MRYLWVEDFGEDSEDQGDKQERWEAYFGIKDNILLYSLEEALKYLDNQDNRGNFDAVLLDIRFPVLGDESQLNERDIYQMYFSNIITENMFNKYANSEVMKDASSGILLFLALIYRYGYNWNNVAFVSANIDDEDLSAINILKELMTKVKYKEKLSVREKELYKTRYLDMFSEDGIIAKKIGTVDQNLNIIECDDLVNKSNEAIISEQVKKLNTIQEKINKEIPEPKREGLKYCSVRNQFELIGLKMPPAFEKPTDESQSKCWLFQEWKEDKLDDVTLTKRTIIDICKILDCNIHGNVNAFLEMQRKYNDDDSTITEETIKQYLQSIIRSVTDFPGVKTQDNKRIYANGIVETISSVWESIKKPRVNQWHKDSYYLFAYYSVMRLSRNWMAHQGIKGIDIQFAAFVFLISVKGIFNINRLNSDIQYNLQEKEEKLIKIFQYNSIVYTNLDVNVIMEEEYNTTYERVRKAIPENYSGQMRLPKKEKKDPFALISALGHSDSCVRESVSVNELYRVFWMAIYFGDENSSPFNMTHHHSSEIVKILEGIYFYQK